MPQLRQFTQQDAHAEVYDIHETLEDIDESKVLE